MNVQVTLTHYDRLKKSQVIGRKMNADAQPVRVAHYKTFLKIMCTKFVVMVGMLRST